MTSSGAILLLKVAVIPIHDRLAVLQPIVDIAKHGGEQAGVDIEARFPGFDQEVGGIDGSPPVLGAFVIPEGDGAVVELAHFDLPDRFLDVGVGIGLLGGVHVLGSNEVGEVAKVELREGDGYGLFGTAIGVFDKSAKPGAQLRGGRFAEDQLVVDAGGDIVGDAPVDGLGGTACDGPASGRFS